MSSQASMQPQHVAEYEQLCEHYRQGYRTLVAARQTILDVPSSACGV